MYTFTHNGWNVIFDGEFHVIVENELISCGTEPWGFKKLISDLNNNFYEECCPEPDWDNIAQEWEEAEFYADYSNQY